MSHHLLLLFLGLEGASTGVAGPTAIVIDKEGSAADDVSAVSVAVAATGDVAVGPSAVVTVVSTTVGVNLAAVVSAGAPSAIAVAKMKNKATTTIPSTTINHAAIVMGRKVIWHNAIRKNEYKKTKVMDDLKTIIVDVDVDVVC